MNTSLSIVAPVFAVILTGYLAGRLNVLGADAAATLNRFVFYFALPPALFVFMARAPIESILNWPFIGAFVGGVLGTFLITVLVGWLWFHQDMTTRAVAGLSTLQANTMYMGFPILLAAYGPAGGLPPIIATFCLIVPFIMGVVALLEVGRASGEGMSRLAIKLAGKVMRNPLIISPLLGISFSIAALPLPTAATNYLDLMAATVGPAALFALGLSLIDRKLSGSVAEVIWLSLVKAVVSPLLTVALVTYVFAMDPFWAKAAIILSAMPTGVNAYVVAQQYNVHAETVSSVVVVSTGMSVLTVTLLLIWLG